MMSEDDSNNQAYEVGRGRPPIHTQFQPGKSGNPRGRPKKTKELNALIAKELDKLIVIKEAGREKRITKREAVVTQLVNGAIKGQSKPLQIMLAHLENTREIEPFVSTELDDEALLQALSPMATTPEDSDDKG